MIYIIRHGQTDLNAQGRTQGRTGLPLNNTGIEQTTEIHEQLKNIKFDFVFSSPQERAIQTAFIATNIEPIVESRIDVFDLGTADNLKKTEIKMNGLLPDTTIYSGVENPKDYVKRIFAFMKDNESKFKDNSLNILISGHKDTTGCMRAFFEGMSNDGNFMRFALSNGKTVSYFFNEHTKSFVLKKLF